ncbi:hypothetical protein E0H45_42140 [Kribbella soli]|uniref:Uncharacterized protein n=1 Tax=Kribbella soli TaxID=1124743 RepID=A0A4R0GW63_9ACTN|nr:hypothetical protein E0H45_42140 [Kribbella soli]
MTAARTAGFTCRSLAALAQPTIPLEPGTDTWRLAGAVDRYSRGGRVQPDDVTPLVAVLDRIERNEIKPPERAVRKPASSNKAQAVHALEAALAAKAAADMKRLVAEALQLLGATQAAEHVTSK